MTRSTVVIPDGLSFDTALPVDTVAEEHGWLEVKVRGFTRVEQSVQNYRGGTFDVMVVKLPEGAHASMYFDITNLVEAPAAGFSGDDS